MNPDQLARGTLRGHLEPQLRGPAGPGRAHPPDEPGAWPPAAASCDRARLTDVRELMYGDEAEAQQHAPQRKGASLFGEGHAQVDEDPRDPRPDGRRQHHERRHQARGRTRGDPSRRPPAATCPPACSPYPGDALQRQDRDPVDHLRGRTEQAMAAAIGSVATGSRTAGPNRSATHPAAKDVAIVAAA
jgi:hypothetical protein